MAGALDSAIGRQYVRSYAGGMVRKLLSASSPPTAPEVNFAPSISPPNEGSFLSRAFNTNVMIMVAVVLFALVMVVVLSTIARCRVVRRLELQEQLHPGELQQQQGHRLKGLRKDQIEALPVITFGTVKLDVEGDGINDCVVCLNDYQKGDKVRLLPLCKHSFHLDCIDIWLSTHTSCPLCRHGVLQQQPTDDHHTTADPALEADHQSSAAEDSQDGAASNTQHGNVRRATSLGRRSATFGRSMMIFGRGRVGSPITTGQQHMEIEVERGRRDVAGGASTSDQSARWSFSGMSFRFPRLTPAPVPSQAQR